MNIEIKFLKTIFFGIVLLMLFTIFFFGINRKVVLAEGEIPITTWVELNAVRNNLSGSYILMNDLDETTAGYNDYASSIANAGAGWAPIGTITGNFDGNNYTITGLYINRPLTDNIGLISSTAEIKNVGLIDINVTGGNYVGGLSSGNSGTISNSYVTGTVSGTNYVGGLVGSNSGIINNSYSAGTVTGTDRVGGLVGQDFSGTTSNSYSTATVSGNAYIGGLYGWNQGTINSSYSTGAVTGTAVVGGLVGINGTNISNSYSTGSVIRSSGSHTYFGGFVGEQSGGGTITNSYSVGNISYAGADNPTNKGFAGQGLGTFANCFWDTEISEQTTSAGAATGKTTEEMKTVSTFTDATWDFAATWAMGNGRNSGYAYLQSIPPSAIWTLTYTAGENGSITGDTSQSVDNGEDGTTVEAVPAEGYVFVNWSDESTSNPRTDTNITEGISVIANFAINTHTLTYTAGDNGSITGSSSQIVNDGEDGSEVTAVPNEGYVFVNWSDESTDNPRKDIDVASDITVTANFAIAEVDEEVEVAPEEVLSEPERAKITSWSAYKYSKERGDCRNKLKLTIKGKHFDNDAKVFIGGREASSVDVKNSKKLTAKFCLDKLLDNKTDHKKRIYVENPDTKKRKADKQIDLNNLSFENEKMEATNNYYNQKTQEGARHIQKDLNKLGYLDQENITGTYGKITTESVKKFQSDNGIESTGFVGPLTKTKLVEKLK